MPLLFDEQSNKVLNDAKRISNDYSYFHVGVEHLTLAIMEVDDKVSTALSRLGIDKKSLKTKILEIAGSGDRETSAPSCIIESPRYKKVLKESEKTALSLKAFRIEPIHILITILREKTCVPLIAIRELFLDPKEIENALMTVQSGGEIPQKKDGDVKDEKGMTSKTPKLLAQFSRDLIELAKSGKMDPVIGRNDEVRRVLQIITRKGKNNPVLIGEAGVGKTAVVFGLAQRIAEGKVPEMLQNKRVLDLSLSSMVAGAKHRGEFEERLQAVIREVAENPDIILFIDEIHTIVGAGDSKGGMDAGNILKPMLARGEFPVIGATTTDEYHRFIEADPALERRFQPVLVAEPSEEDTLAILKGLQERYEKHHGVKFTDKSLLAAVKLSVRYLPDRNLPDKAIDLIDESAAKVKMRSVSLSDGDTLAIEVTEDVVAEVVSLWTGIPVSKLTSEEKERLLTMESYLTKRVIGQNDAIRIVSQTIRMVRMGLGNPNRPSGIFLFLGPTGVGKTELAKTLADFLFGSERDMVRLDMSEFMEKHAISRLIGSPPGYVGYDEEGQLTKAVRTKPYSVVLLDEIEKAHPEVFDLFLQVFDDGRLTDSKGRTVNFTNTIIILTSNIGTSKVDEEGNTILIDTNNPATRESIFQDLRKSFRPEFLNRIDEIIIFSPLGKESLKDIITLSVAEILKRIEDKGIALQFEESAFELFLKMGYNPSYGARPLKRAIQTHLTKPLAEKMLMLGEGFTGFIKVQAHPDEDRLVFEVTSDFQEDHMPQTATGKIGDSERKNIDDTVVGGSDEDQH